MDMKKGIAISPGIAVARAYRIDQALTGTTGEKIETSMVPAELARFDHACERAAQDLDRIIQRVAREVDQDSARIFHSHRLLIRDPALNAKVKSLIIHQHVNAVTGLRQTLQDYEKLFSKIEDDYLRERIADIRDVTHRLVAQLISAQKPENVIKEDESIIIVAQEILPSQAVMFNRFQVGGIVTESGGTTGHAAILARSMGIPAVSGIQDLLQDVKTGDLLVIDGREGLVVLNPGPEVESAYRKMQREYVNLRDALVENRDIEAITPDGEKIELLANANTVLDAAAATGVGAAGIGLFRTEFVYLSHSSVPNEEEQVAAYRNIIETAPHNRVIIRTLDLGGDKQVPYLGSHHEANPFMGWRSIRLTTQYPEFFQTQIRAILRAAVFGKVSILFPMVTTLEEVIRLSRLLENTKMDLRRQNIPFAENTPFGVMIEVPAAAICIDQLLDEVDFISIGSNDLIQYIMAADRDNPKVAHLCEPFHPSIYRILKHIIQECTSRQKPVTLCGEMSARPACLLALMGLGIRRFSMSPAFIPTAKEMVLATSLTEAKRSIEQILKMKSSQEIREHLKNRVRQLCPKVTTLDTL